LNGVCVAGACKCDAAWHGPSCELLSLLPSAPGDGTCDPSLNGTATGFTTTWGGHPMQDADGSWHLQVAEMAQHCGMCSWGSVSEVAHWASGALAGPYSRVSTAVGAFAHNPAVVAAPPDAKGGSALFLMWHIGIGCDSAGVHACNYTRMPSCANGSTPLHPQPPLKPVPNPPNLTRAVVHMAVRLGGPWAPVPPSWKLPSCNNPSPLFLRNGSLMVMCHGPYSQCPQSGGLSFFTSFASVDWRFGPFGFHCLNILNPDFSFNGTTFHTANEDPHLWQDARGALHVLTHNQSPCYSGPVAAAFYGADVRGCGGHFFSADGGLSWTFSWHAAYNGTVHFTDGRVRVYKRERPKLVQNAQGAIIALANGVGPALVDSFQPGNDTACSLVVAVGR
jgi:hypothetical protein